MAKQPLIFDHMHQEYYRVQISRHGSRNFQLLVVEAQAVNPNAKVQKQQWTTDFFDLLINRNSISYSNGRK